tara:strand:- start:570 stop:1178 length:609 start_codon:yes stop_codon:yes gene_type:complete
MAISKTEAALYGYITGKTVPKGTTRKVFRTLVSGAIGAGRAIIPPLARGTGRTALGLGRLGMNLSPAGKVILGGMTLYEAQQAGLLDEPIERSRQAAIDAALYGIDRTSPYMPDRTPDQMWDDLNRTSPQPKRKPTKYNRAVKAGMAAAKASQYFGKKKTLSNSKAAFKAVNSVASRINKGKKVSVKGATGKIARAVRRILK